ncbi:MAG: hypothetical protein HY348_12460 [Nitrospira defluvii]|nr:hypothetical protein [Nitrospira defluvii]
MPIHQELIAESEELGILARKQLQLTKPFWTTPAVDQEHPILVGALPKTGDERLDVLLDAATLRGTRLHFDGKKISLHISGGVHQKVRLPAV